MKGYFNNERATEECFEGGWFHTGDIGVLHKDGRVELKDRSKGLSPHSLYSPLTSSLSTSPPLDIIISGGENISSVEVETIMLTHPHIFEVAVVAMPDDKWGEVPCAFVNLERHKHELFQPTVHNLYICYVRVEGSSPPSEESIIQWCRTKMVSDALIYTLCNASPFSSPGGLPSA